MLIPYNTDAPIYHFPYATIGLIGANALAFYAELPPTEVDEILPWTLQFGQGLHPVQWVTNNFLHDGPMHLLGNMFFLWGFGLVVEGKLGWWKFLSLYLVIGLTYSAILQVAMLGSEGAALGASGVLFGLMAIALVWAPKNEMSCFLWIIRPFLLDVPITIFAMVYLVFEGLAAWIGGFSMSSSMLHLTGAGVGLVFGIALLKLKLVDCEGWDIFAVMADRAGAKPEPKVTLIKPPPPPPPPLSDEDVKFLTTALKNRIASGDAAGAARLYQTQRQARPNWVLGKADLLGLVKGLHQHKLWSESVAPMVDYLRQFPDDAVRVRLKLAQILIDAERRPAKALKVLRRIDPAALPAELSGAYGKLLARAEQMQGECDLEVVEEEEEW